MNEKIQLVGWDDGKIYFYLNGEERCISDEPELFAQVIALCRRYYEQRAEEQADTNAPSNKDRRESKKVGPG